MRIISSHRDYYDCMQRTDADKKTLWIRKTKVIKYEGDKYILPTMSPSYSNGYLPNVDQNIIGFCGKIYPFLILSHPQISSPAPDRKVLCTNIGQVDAFVKGYLPADYVERFFNEKMRWKSTRWMSRSLVPRREFVKFFEECKKKETAFERLFYENRCPVFVGTYPGYERKTSNPWYGEICFNAEIGSFGFAAWFPPPQAYQEIWMFINNLAVPQEKIPKLDDVTMAEAKGFDKFSFRKDPIRKRRRA